LSDEDVARAFDDLEALLNAGPPEAQAVDAWHQAFKAALAQAERGPSWPGLKARGAKLAARLNEQVESLKPDRAISSAGTRALRGYSQRSF
jgi:hypothetical protein